MFVMMTCVACTSNHVPKVIVLGVDGMDPAFVERHWTALPNLRRLRDQGQFSRLATTSPPQSPVAWSTFITGLAPAEHGIYDFVHRDPATLQLYSSISRTEEPRFHIPVGPYDIPLSSARVASARKGTPFWQTLSKRGIPVKIIRMPTNYPPAPAGQAIAGMGVPDLTGTLGTFGFYTNNPAEPSRSVFGGRIENIPVLNGRAVLHVPGPPNTLRNDRAVVNADLVVDVDPKRPVARLTAGETLTVLREGEWSDWLALDFPLLPSFVGVATATVRGTFRVYAKQLHPFLALYISAINADPLRPALPLSYPSNWSRDVALEAGRFFTQGIPEDTSALRQGVLNMSEFQAQARIVFEDEQRLLRYSLRHFDRGLLFFYFSSIDQNSHILWGRHEAELLDVYRAVDRCIGEVRQAKPDAEMIVLSDHGFSNFSRAVHLNTWLRNHGFLASNQQPGLHTTLDGTDWSFTQAYAVGLNGLYLNRKGREKFGIVPDAKRSATLEDLRRQLTAWRDPATGKQVIEAVMDNPVSPGNALIAPDLIVGYAPGYRASWQTALGGLPQQEIEDNNDFWIGDHCINPTAVPGVLFTSTRQDVPPLRLQDVTELISRLLTRRLN